MTRRTLLLAASGLSVTSLSLGFLLMRRRGKTPTSKQLEEELIQSLKRLVGVNGAGAMPLAVGDWPTRHALDRLVGDLLPDEVASILADDVALLRRLEELQQHDLEQGRVHLVEGWLLSETEISVAALVRVPRHVQ